MGATLDARNILVRDGFRYPILLNKAIHPAVTPGPKLDALNAAGIAEVSKAIDALVDQAPETLKLFEWVRKQITVTSTEAVYVRKNPLRSESLQAAYWKFEPGIIIVLLNLYPSLLARESVQARAQIVNAFAKYFASGGHEQDSAFVQAHCQHKVDQGLEGKEVANFEIDAVVALLINTFAATLWVLYHVISDAAILQECRAELLVCCSTDERTCTLDITKVKSSCPVLSFVLKESLRFHGIGTSVRIVMKDYVLEGKYLLKKGGIVMIPGQVQHTSRAAYGDSVGEFQHKRFVRSKGRERPDPIAFHGFGGGTTLCPGRNFATTVIIAFVAKMILRLDFEPVAGVWRCPTTEKAGMHATVTSLDGDVDVSIAPAVGGLAGRKLEVVLSESDKGMKLVAEDGA